MLRVAFASTRRARADGSLVVADGVLGGDVVTNRAGPASDASTLLVLFGAVASWTRRHSFLQRW